MSKKLQKMTVSESRCYRMPDWISEEMVDNFLGMWRCFNRTPLDYYENDSTELNGAVCIAGWRSGDYVVGEYYHKWNNMGWILFDGKVYTVDNAEIYEK